MIIDKDNVVELLREQVTKSLYPLKMGGSIDMDAFSELLLIAEESTRIFEHEDLVPKNLLSEIILISIGIDSENEYIKDQYLDSVSKKIRRCCDLILSGKVVDAKSRQS